MQHLELVGNTHIHSRDSDGTGSMEDITAAAIEAGLDFIIVTDHNAFAGEPAARSGPLLVLRGQEVHRGSGDHLLILGAGRDLSHLGGRPQALIDAAGAAGALTFLAHPVERAAAAPRMAAIPWRSWQVEGFTGMEIWNYMSEIKGALTSHARALLTAFAPSLVCEGPLPESLAAWDDRLRYGPVVGIGSSDAHADWYSLGPLRKQVFPYSHLFRCVNTHVLVDGRLPEDPGEAAAAVYRALARGHCFVGYDLAAATKGFVFRAIRAGAAVAVMGDAIEWSPDVRLEVALPRPARLRLLRDGAPVVVTDGPRLTFSPLGPGVYRVEALRHFRGRHRGWIYSNPIYLM